MSCDQYETLLLRLPDGDLTEGEKRALAAHLHECPDCMALYEALSEAERELRAPGPEDPAALRAGVMERIRAQGERDTAPVDIRRARGRRRFPGRALTAAACLVVILGGGAYIGKTLLAPKAAPPESGPVLEQILPLDEREAPLAALEEAAEAVPEEAPMPEAAAAGTAAFSAAADAQSAMEEPSEAEAAYPDEAADRDAGPVFTADAPASVLPGQEEAFRAMISDGGTRDAGDPGPLTVVAAAEYRGVIYEFSTDWTGTRLYWRDASEGVTPVLSPARPDDLWTVIG